MAYLRHGQALHTTLQYQHKEALREQGIDAQAEVPLTKPSGKQGRADLFAFLDKDSRDGLITEFKTDRFDRLSPPQLQTRVDKYVQQVKDYRESRDLNLASSQSFLHIDERPAMEGYAEYIEERCLEEGIMVFFLNE